MWKNADIPRWHVSPPPSWTLVLQSPTTPSEFDIWQSGDIPSSDVSHPPANQPEWYRALVHHVSLTCGRMHTYPGQMYPTPWIGLSSTDPYYTMSIWHVQECRHTQVTYTTPSINPSGTKLQYTMSVSHVEQYRHTHIRCIPPQMEPNATEPYYTISVSYVEEWRCTQVICTLPLTTRDIWWRRAILCDIMFLYVTQICVKCKNKLQTDGLVVFSLYSLWRFTCVEDAYKHYSHLITFLSQ